MTTDTSRNLSRSTLAVLAGIITVFVLSLGIDQVLHVLGIYPPWGEPMNDPGLNFLALGYRIVIGILGGYITAKLAPRHPMKHALIMGSIGLVLSVAGVFAALQANLGPIWYPIALAASALPCAWLGGALGRRREPAAAGV